MLVKRLSKSIISTIIKRSVLLTLFIVLAPFIYIFATAFFMWDGNCTESSRPVALARSLSQEQLADLNARIMELSEQYPYAQLTNHTEPYIPDDLEYLDALYIAPGGDYPSIVLTKCNVSVGVDLNFGPSRTGQDLIELNWYAPTDEKPYQTGSEILWTAPELNPAIPALRLQRLSQ